MVKSRKKKNEKKDFQKVKLKVGKKLPKADNATDVSFKSKGIHIKEQLKEAAGLPSTRRKQNINDLLSQTHHYNVSVRHDALAGLKELIATHPEVGCSHFSSIIEHVSTLFVDKDPVIRQTVLKLYNVLFPKISANQLTPFFPVINAHLCCAMTHIDEQIQGDSLAIVDILLKFYPSVLIDHCSQLLPNFINLISKRTQTGTKTGSGSRTLSINPSTKLHAQKWRMKVLERLHSFLSALAENVNSRTKRAGITEITTEIICAGAPVYYQPMAQHLNPIPFCGSFQLRPQQTAKTCHQDILNQPEELKNFVSTLIPLLLDCWVECSPASLIASVPGNAPASETIATMMSIIKVIQLLWQCVQGLSRDNEEISMSWLAETYMNEFVHHFMAYFPYSGQELLERSKKNKKVEIKQVSMMALNLRVCDIMVYFIHEKLAQVSHSHWIHNMTDFIIAAAEGSRLPVEEGQLLLEILRRLLKVDIPEGSSLLSDLLEAVWSMYKRSHPASAERRGLLSMISEDILPKKHYISYPIMQEWLSSLPHFLLSCKSEHTATVNLILSAMGKVAAQRHHIFCSSFEKHLESFLDPENGTLLNLSTSHQRKFIEILHMVPNLDKGALKSLLMCCRNDQFDVKNVGYLLQVLHHRYSCHGDKFCDTSAFLSFLLSLCVGFQSGSIETRDDYLILAEVNEQTWERQQKIIQFVIGLLRLWPNARQVWAVIMAFIMKCKRKSSNLSFTNGIAILELLNNLYLPGASVDKHGCQELSDVLLKVAGTTKTLEQNGSVSQMEVDGTLPVSQNEPGAMSSAHFNYVWKLLQDVFTTLPSLVNFSVERLMDLLEGDKRDDHHLFLATLLQLIKPQSVKSLKFEKDSMKCLVNSILVHHSDPQYAREVAAIKYELSMF